jgi:hypothetical protein
MLNNAWGKADAESLEIQNFKKEIEQFCDKLLVKRKVTPSSPQVSRRKLVRVSTWILRVERTEEDLNSDVVAPKRYGGNVSGNNASKRSTFFCLKHNQNLFLLYFYYRNNKRCIMSSIRTSPCSAASPRARRRRSRLLRKIMQN